MRKLFTFLFAALMSVGMFAKVTPKGTDVWDDATKTLTVNGNPESNAYINVSDIENLVISDAVTSIGDNAFENCNGLKSVSFGSSLASIGKEAFASCIKLESVTFPASLQSIGKKAFSQCYALTSVTITNGLTSIGQQAFYNCEKLTSVTIPSSVTDIGSSAFGNCKVLTGIVVAAENPNYSSADGVLFDKDKTTLIQCPGGKQGEYTVPNSVTSIGNNAFANCFLLTSVEIPNSVGEIGVQAFSSCIGLTSVTIGNGVTSIGGYAFYYSSKLASVTINATTPPTLGGSALDKTAAALTIYVPAASVTDYKGAWTAYADKIEAIAGGASAITVTWDAATIAALNLEEGDEFTKDNVKLKVNNNAYVENSDFEGSSSNAFTFSLTNDQFFHSIVVTCSSSNANAAGWKESGTTVTWRGNAASVDYGDDFTGVSSIVFTIGPWVLEGDVWDEATKTLTVNSNPGEAAYLGRTEIEHLIISNAVTSIGISAFKSCTNLSSVTFGNSVESIGLYAFGECSNLASIELPASIQSIGNYAFMYCSQLASLTCNAVNPPTIGNALFFGWGALAHIYVPAGSVDDYKGATGWSAKASIIEAIPGDEPAATVVTITDSDFPSEGQSFTKDGVTVSAVEIDGSWGDLLGGGSFSTTLGNFTQIEVTAADVYTLGGEGWSGNAQKKTWTGNASSVSFSGDIYGYGLGTTLKFTIESQGGTTGVENVQTNQVQTTKILRDGMLFIEKNGKIYNATGAEVK